jgi:hypothetical protein
MESTVVINEVSLSVKEFNGERVVTFKDIDTVHGRPEGTAKRNFIKNKEHFIDGTDYYVLKKNDVGTNFVLTYGFNEKAPSGTVLTEMGYLMIAKSLTDEKAWQVQRDLVNSYFKLKEVHHHLSEELPVNMQSLYQTVISMSNNFKIMCAQVNSMENAFDEQFEEFKRIIQQLSGLSLASKKEPLKIEEITVTNKLTVTDPIRDKIKPLAESYNDKSVGYNNTYRKVYATMEVDWKRRQSRYKNVKGNKNRPSKFHLLEEDQKLLSIFNDTVNKLLTEAQA